MSPAVSKLIAVALIALLTFINCRGVRFGAAVQDLLTLLKVGGLATLVLAAFVSPINHLSFGGGSGFEASRFGAAMVACLLSYDGWVALGFVAGEVKNPRRNLTLGTALGLASVIAIYVVANLAFLKILTPAETAAADRVGTAVAERTMGAMGASIVALAILLSTAGSANGWLMTAPRVYFAQARDGLFFSRFASIHPRFETPAFSIVVQGAWAALLALVGAYETLASYAMLAAWLFYGVTALGVIVLRRKQPDRPRPYRMWGYPFTPLLFAAVAFGFVLNTLVTDPRPSLSAIALIAAGIPVYFFWRRSATVEKWTR
jgi:basic amino acid/polyamine antiporter, APA family